MDIQLSLSSPGNGIWKFQISFENNSQSIASIPIDAIKRSGERIGLRFQLDDENVEPVDFTIVSPKKIPEDISLQSGEKINVDFEAVLENKQEGICALSFKHAVYRIFLNRCYRIKFEWQNMSSNTLEWCPELNNR